jgi:hypothetical protein
MKKLEYKHYFKVINGNPVYEDMDMYRLVMRNLEGKRGFSIIKDIEEDTSPNQFGYYFGGIIRQECMNSECFVGWTEKQIHEYFLKEIEGEMKMITMGGKTRIAEVCPSFPFGKKKMAEYITKVIAKLQTEFDIHPRPAEHYKYNKYHIDPQIFKHEDLERDSETSS